MAFKSLAVFAALALLAVVPLPEVSALSVQAHDHLVSRAPHSALARRQTKSGKRCPAYRGPGPQPTKSAATTKTTEKPTSSAAKPPKATNAAPLSHKAGMIYTGSHPGFLKKANDATGGNIAFTYNWGPDKPDEADETRVPFIPTLWGWKSVDQWYKVKRGYAKAAFGCNEVDHQEQADMSPQEGVKIWKKYMSPLKNEGYDLYSHSFTNAERGAAWLQKFHELCPECRDETSAINVHFYGNRWEKMRDYLIKIHETFDKPLIVTEFGCANYSGDGGRSEGCSQPEIVTFMREITQFMDNQHWIVAYTAFAAFPPSDMEGGMPSGNALYNEDSSLSEVGKTYFWH